MASREERSMSFGAIADDYDRLRSGPPEAAVDWLLPAHCEVAVDLAAGTGLLSRALASKVAQVIAVEPDERMAAVLRAQPVAAQPVAAQPVAAQPVAAQPVAAQSPGIRVVRGRGEAIPIPDARADGVFISSAWHWLDPERAITEIGRVLRDGGRFGVIWTGPDREDERFGASVWTRRDDWFRGSDPSREARQRDHGGTGQAEARPRSRRREVMLPDGSPFGQAQTASFAFTRAMTISDILGLLATYSRVITASPQDREAGLARARAELEQRFPGSGEIDVPMRSWCWRADRAERPAPCLRGR